MNVCKFLMSLLLAVAAEADEAPRVQYDLAFAYRYLDEAVRMVVQATGAGEVRRWQVAAAICESDALVCTEFRCAAGTPLPVALQELYMQVGPSGRLRSRVVENTLIVDRALPEAELQQLRRDAAAATAVGDWAGILDRIAASGDLQAVALAFDGLVAADPAIRRLTDCWLDWTWMCYVADPVWLNMRVFAGDEAVKQHLLKLREQGPSDRIAGLLQYFEKAETKEAEKEDEKEERAKDAPLVTAAQVEHALAELLSGRRWPGDTVKTLRHAGSRAAIEGMFTYLEKGSGSGRDLRREQILQALIKVISEAAAGEQTDADRRRLITPLLQAVRDGLLPDGLPELAAVASYSEATFRAGLQELVADRESLLPDAYNDLMNILVAAPINLKDPDGATCLLYAAEPTATAPLARWQRYATALAAHPCSLAINRLKEIADTASQPVLRRQAQLQLLQIPCPQAETCWQTLLAEQGVEDSGSAWFADYLQERDAFPKNSAPQRLLQFVQRLAEKNDLASRRSSAAIAKTWFQYFAVNTHRGHARLDCMLKLARLLAAYLPQEPDQAIRSDLLPEWVDEAGGAGSASAALVLEALLLQSLHEDPHPWVRCRAAEILSAPMRIFSQADGGLTTNWRAALLVQAEREIDPAAQELMRRLLAGDKKVKLDRWPPKGSRTKQKPAAEGVDGGF